MYAGSACVELDFAKFVHGNFFVCVISLIDMKSLFLFGNQGLPNKIRKENGCELLATYLMLGIGRRSH